MFTDNIDPIMTNVVEKISGKYLQPKRIGTIIWDWTSGEGQLQTNKFKIYYNFQTHRSIS